MRLNISTACAVSLILGAATLCAAPPSLFSVTKKQRATTGDNTVVHRCLTPHLSDALPANGLERKHPWSLPTGRRSALPDTIRCLVLRYNFLPDTDPNTTGTGVIDVVHDIAWYDSVAGHIIDHPPRNARYFDSHMRALNSYWGAVSEGKLNLTWDIFPVDTNAAFQLPHEMSYYGRCEFSEVVAGLENYFVDAIRIADSAHIIIPGHPDIDFSQYDAFFLFHAGSDRQNDIGFPPTCNDLFTGFIRFGGAVPVDGGTDSVSTALLMPETASQDGRATALNAVMAHEFGHHLGLPDLYSTRTFLSQLGDFELMDNNGFGTGVDFDFDVGDVFGTIPVFPSAWCRAYLGIDEVVDFRQGDDIRLVAAAVQSLGIEIARVPISEKEYYLLENRSAEIDSEQTAIIADTITTVILGPGDFDRNLSGEYDFLLPADGPEPTSGVLIFHVDESVAEADYDGDGVNNFFDNQLQLFRPDRKKFITLIEADGLVNFGGNYRAGFGSPQDMYREDRNSNFTPNTNPPSISNSGGQTRVFVTNIRRDPLTTPPDTAALFDLEMDKRAEGFPVRVGEPLFGLSPIADDVDKDGSAEFIVASDKLLSVFTTEGRGLLNKLDSCAACPAYFDTVGSEIPGWSENNSPELKPVPIFYVAQNFISANPVTGNFSPLAAQKLIVVGFPTNTQTTPGDNGKVVLLAPFDVNNDGRADSIGNFPTDGWPAAMSFGNKLWVLTDRGNVYRIDSVGGAATLFALGIQEYNGIARLGDRLVVLAGDSASTRLYVLAGSTAAVDSFEVGGYCDLGPVVADVNRDGIPEVATFGNASHEGMLVSIDTTAAAFAFVVLATIRRDDLDFTTNPIAGDVDRDGYADIVVGGIGVVYAFGENLVLKTDYPRKIDPRFIEEPVLSTPTMSDMRRGGEQEIIVTTDSGNVYARSDAEPYGFPLSSGELLEDISDGSVVTTLDSTGGLLGFIGADGWFYGWRVDPDSSAHWPMYGHDPAGSFALTVGALGAPVQLTTRLPEERFFNYENPVLDGNTVIRYYLGEDASEVVLTIFDMSGQEIARLTGAVSGGVDNEVFWSCADVTPGVYRCIIEATFGTEKESQSTDIAIIR